MMTEHKLIQEKWEQGLVLGYDCISYGDGKVTVANTYRVIDVQTSEPKQFWFPLCDTTVEGIMKYDDVWTEVDIYHGAFEYKNQKFVFGDGGMGNEGYVASTTLEGVLNWAIFFTFSNPIDKAEVIDEHLICYGDSGVIQVSINLNDLTKITVTLNNEGY